MIQCYLWRHTTILSVLIIRRKKRPARSFLFNRFCSVSYDKRDRKCEWCRVVKCESAPHERGCMQYRGSHVTIKHNSACRKPRPTHLQPPCHAITSYLPSMPSPPTCQPCHHLQSTIFAITSYLPSMPSSPTRQPFHHIQRASKS